MHNQMNETDNIYELIDWHRSAEEQNKGIAMADKISNLEYFLQPNTLLYNKNIWENCAKIISVRSDKEIQPYLCRLLEWIQDLNWPGAKCIYDRLVCFSDNDSFIKEYNKCVSAAKETNDLVWLTNLEELQKDRGK